MKKQAIVNALNGFRTRMKSYIDNKFNTIRTNVITTPTSFSLATTAWTQLSSAKGEYTYSATLSISNILSKDSIDVIFDIDSLPICITAEVAPAVAVNNGNIVLYAKKVPTATVKGAYYIIKG